MPRKGETMSQEQKDKISTTMRARKKQPSTEYARSCLAEYREQTQKTYLLNLKLKEQGIDVGEIGDGIYYHHSQETKNKISASLKAMGHRPNNKANKRLAEYRKEMRKTALLKKRLLALGFTEESTR